MLFPPMSLPCISFRVSLAYLLCMSLSRHIQPSVSSSILNVLIILWTGISKKARTPQTFDLSSQSPWNGTKNIGSSWQISLGKKTAGGRDRLKGKEGGREEVGGEERKEGRKKSRNSEKKGERERKVSWLLGRKE